MQNSCRRSSSEIVSILSGHNFWAAAAVARVSYAAPAIIIFLPYGLLEETIVITHSRQNFNFGVQRCYCSGNKSRWQWVASEKSRQSIHDLRGKWMTKCGASCWWQNNTFRPIGETTNTCSSLGQKNNKIINAKVGNSKINTERTLLLSLGSASENLIQFILSCAFFNSVGRRILKRSDPSNLSVGKMAS